MKLILVTALTFVLFGCDSSPSKTSTVKGSIKDTIAHLDNFYLDDNEINGDEHKEFHSCDFEEIVKDTNTPKLAKDIYFDNEWKLNIDNDALALLDSLTAEDKSARPFYFKVVTKTMEKSDGYFAEGLGYAGKQYVENNTQEFVAYFDNKQCFTERDLTTWVDILMLEFSLLAENEFDKLYVDNYLKELNINCKNCSAIHKETLNKFSLILREEWHELLKHLD